LDVGQAVFLKNNARKSKLDHKYTPYFRIVEKKTPVTFVIRNILDGTILHAHAGNLKKANFDEWGVEKQNVTMRKTTQAAPVSSDGSISSSLSDSNHVEGSQAKSKCYRKRKLVLERSDSSDSDDSDIPLAEIRRN
jgi:hypothetical protein